MSATRAPRLSGLSFVCWWFVVWKEGPSLGFHELFALWRSVPRSQSRPEWSGVRYGSLRRRFYPNIPCTGPWLTVVLSPAWMGGEVFF